MRDTEALVSIQFETSYEAAQHRLNAVQYGIGTKWLAYGLAGESTYPDMISSTLCGTYCLRTSAVVDDAAREPQQSAAGRTCDPISLHPRNSIGCIAATGKRLAGDPQV